jgi:hypothetical protein
MREGGGMKGVKIQCIEMIIQSKLRPTLHFLVLYLMRSIFVAVWFLFSSSIANISRNSMNILITLILPL